jgi:methylphosphotriester-DNA--protein-cysteine methyltransferase
MDGLIRMKNALDLIERQMEDRLGIEEIAKAAYVSPFHFQRDKELNYRIEDKSAFTVTG